MINKITITVAILLIVIIIIAPKYFRVLNKAKEKVASYTSYTVNTPIVPIEYCATGKGSPILISHGITGGLDQGFGLADNYVGKGYNIIAVSRFGYLNSPIPKDSSPEAQAEVYRDLLDKLNIDKVFILGNSAGGTSAIKFALNYPDRCLGLILVSSNVPSKVKMPPKPIMKIVFGNNFVYWSLTKLLKTPMLSLTGVPKSILKGLTKEEKSNLFNDTVMGGFPVSLRTKGIINDMFVSNPDINNNYPFENIKVPVLMVGAKDDTFCSYEGALGVSKKIPNIEFISYEKGGHMLLGHENDVKKEIADFIYSIN